MLFHRTELLGREVGLESGVTNSGGGLVTPIIVGGVGGGAMLLLLSIVFHKYSASSYNECILCVIVARL